MESGTIKIDGQDISLVKFHILIYQNLPCYFISELVLYVLEMRP